jgi:4-amino-4-deoxychorismate lyase
MRDFVLQTAQKSGIQVEQGTFSPEQLLEADELFVTNSIIGIWGIQSLASQSFIIGDITRMLQTRLAQFKQQTLSA